VNNVVDVTNFVLMELGQPLHAFDLDALAEKRIVVRRAGKGEKIQAIDGREYALEPSMLVIAERLENRFDEKFAHIPERLSIVETVVESHTAQIKDLYSKHWYFVCAIIGLAFTILSGIAINCLRPTPLHAAISRHGTTAQKP